MIFISISSLALIIFAFFLRNYKNWNRVYSDPLNYFIFLFVLYGIYAQYGAITIDLTSYDVRFQSNLMVLMASFGIVFGVVIIKLFRSQSSTSNVIQMSNDGIFSLQLASILTILFAYTLLIFNISRIGDFTQIIEAYTEFSRSERMALLSSMRGNLPFSHFFHIGIASLMIARFIRNIKVNFKTELLIIILILPYLAFLMIEGDRSGIVKLLLVIWFPIIYLKNITFKWIHPPILALAVIVFITIGNTRSLIKSDMNSWDYFQSHYKHIFTNTQEFKAVNYSLRAALNFSDMDLVKYPGDSYLQAFPYILPRSIHPGEKRKNIGDRFGEYAKNKFGLIGKTGFGFSPIAESYLNFGIIGVFVVFTIYTFILHLCQILMNNNNIFLKILGFTYMTTLFMFFRNSFAGQFSNFFWLALILLFFYLLFNILNHIIHFRNEIT